MLEIEDVPLCAYRYLEKKREKKEEEEKRNFNGSGVHSLEGKKRFFSLRIRRSLT